MGLMSSRGQVRRGSPRQTPLSVGRLRRGLSVTVALLAVLALVIPAGASALGYEVLGWGSNTYGELGNHSHVSSSTPVEICAPLPTGCAARLNGVVAISAGGERSVALLNTGEVMTWGDNEDGALGDGNTTSSEYPVRVCAPETLARTTITPPTCPGGVLTGVTAISAGDGRNTVALLASGEVVSWGANVNGDLGDGQKQSEALYSDVPVYVCSVEHPFAACPAATERLKEAVAVSAAPDHNAAIIGTKRELVTWGVNNVGQLGQGYFGKDNDIPEHVCETEFPYGPEGTENHLPYCHAGHYLEGVEQITFGLEHNIATFSGRYTYRTCNEGKIKEEEEEAKGKGKGGKGEECCLGSGEEERCCKDDGKGEEGCPGEEIEAEAFHSVVAFGNNEEGQLGDGVAVKPPFALGQGGPAHCVKVSGKRRPCSTVPIHVCEPWFVPGASPCGFLKYLEPVTAIAAGGSHSMALEGTSEVLTWGEDEVPAPVSAEAILGHPPLSTCSFVGRPCSSTPEPVLSESGPANLSGIAAIAGGSLHNLALTTGKEVFAWGDGQEGRLGNGGTAAEARPVKVCSVAGCTSHLKEVAAIAAGNKHSLALVQCKLKIEPPPPHPGGNSNQIQAAERGLPYTHPFIPGCNLIKPLGWEVISGELPHGLTLGEETGEITGTPSEDGTSHFVLRLTNGEAESASMEVSLTVVSPPDFGTCEAASAEGAGSTFTDKGCTKPETGEARGKYEWLPGVEKTGFTLVAKGSVTLEGVAKQTVSCAGASGDGAYSSPQEVVGVVLRLTGCESRGEPCMSGELGKGEVETSALAGVLGRSSPKEVALDLAPAEPGEPFASYRCGTVASTITGSVLVPEKTDKMATTSELKFSASKGHQKPEAFEGEAPDVLITRFSDAKPEQTGLQATFEMASEEGVEVNAVT